MITITLGFYETKGKIGDSFNTITGLLISSMCMMLFVRFLRNKSQYKKR